MDTLINLKTFLQVVKNGSFAETARQAGIAVSVVKKRVDQFEYRVGSKLLERSTRCVALNETGLRHLMRLEQAARDMEDALGGVRRGCTALDGHMRIKVPPTLNQAYLGEMFMEFQSLHPRLSLEIISLDRTVNPRLEGFDMAVSITAGSLGGVLELELASIQRTVVASPAYLLEQGVPEQPRDLLEHQILCYEPSGVTWVFEGPNGAIDVKLNPRLSCNDAVHLRRAVLAGQGIASLSSYLVQQDLEAGRLVKLLEGFPMPQFWIHLQVPEVKAHLDSVQALTLFLQRKFKPVPPWERGTRTAV